MKITTLQTKSFKNLEDLVYEFGNLNILQGRNGSGKSSISEAVIFALYGRTKTGSTSTSDLINSDSESTVVAVQFDTGTTLVREESRLYGTKIQLNGNVIDQKDLNENIPTYSVFISTFLIGYFFNLDESDQRELILSLTDEIDLKALFIEVTRKPELLEKHLINFKKIDTELKLFKIKLKDLKTLIDHGQVEIDIHNQQIKNTKQPKAKINIDDINKKLNIHAEWDEYERIEKANSFVKEQMDAANNGICPNCNQKRSKEDIDKTLKNLESHLTEQPKKPATKRPTIDPDQLRSMLNEASSVNALYENYEEQILELQKQVTDKENQIRSAGELIPELEEIVNALSPKGIKAMEMRKKLEPIVKALNTDEDHVIKIETLEKLKSRDSYREVFKVSLNSIAYKFLSTGERKLIDIKFSQLVNQFTDKAINMFYLDDAELLSHEDKLTGQVFKAYVTNTDLSIESS